MSLTGVNAYAAQNETVSEQPVIIGEYDGLLSDCLILNTPSPLASYVNVRINSYATYDSTNGVQVKVKLYVPWYETPKPQFTGMTGTVTTKVGSTSKTKSFSKLANGTSTIEQDVNTGVKGTSGATGTVSVSGVATANNALAGGGAFAISYAITIP